VFVSLVCHYGGLVGYFGIDTLANALIFRSGVWGRKSGYGPADPPTVAGVWDEMAQP
jgi:hypothetical protein